jgi:hypothetical protein
LWQWLTLEQLGYYCCGLNLILLNYIIRFFYLLLWQQFWAFISLLSNVCIIKRFRHFCLSILLNARALIQSVCWTILGMNHLHHSFRHWILCHLILTYLIIKRSGSSLILSWHIISIHLFSLAIMVDFILHLNHSVTFIRNKSSFFLSFLDFE